MGSGSKKGRPPAPFHVRFPKPALVGREDALARLRHLLSSGAANISAALAGQGGIGKTQLAVAYAYAYRDAYPGGVFWLDASNPDTLVRQIADHAYRLSFSPPVGSATEDPVRATALAFIGRHLSKPNTLLILDDVKSPSLPMQEIPGLTGVTFLTMGCRLLVTSRRRDIHRIPHFDLGVLDPEAALQLLTRESGQEPDAGARIVVRLLGGLPLALRLAGALIRVTGMRHIDLADRLRERGLGRTLDDGTPSGEPVRLDDYERITALMLEESWSSIPQEAEPARDILRAMGMLPLADPVKRAFVAALSVSDETTRDPLAPYLRLLHDRSLIEILEDGAMLRVHEMIHDFARTRTPMRHAWEAVGRGLQRWLSPAWLAGTDVGTLNSIGSDLAMLWPAVTGHPDLYATLQKATRAFSSAILDNRLKRPQVEPSAILVQLLYFAIRGSFPVLAQAVRKALATRRAAWLETRWTTDIEDVAEMAVIAVGGPFRDYVLSADGATALLLRHDVADTLTHAVRWSLGRGVSERHVVSPAGHPAEAIAISDRGHRFALVYRDWSVELWDVEAFEPIDRLSPNILDDRLTPVGIWHAFLSESGDVLFVTEGGGQAVVYDFGKRTAVTHIIDGATPIGWGIAADGSQAFFEADGALYTMESASGVVRERVRFPEGAWRIGQPRRVDQAPTVALFQETPEDAKSPIFADLAAGLVKAPPSATDFQAVTNACFDGNGTCALLGDGSGSLRLYSFGEDRIVGKAFDTGGSSVALHLDQTGKVAMTVTSQYVVKLWDVTRFQPVDAQNFPSAWAFAPIEGRIVAVTPDGGLAFYDADTGALQGRLPDVLGCIENAAVSSGGFVVGFQPEGGLIAADISGNRQHVFYQNAADDGDRDPDQEEGDADEEVYEDDSGIADDVEDTEETVWEGEEDVWVHVAISSSCVAVIGRNGELTIRHPYDGTVLATHHDRAETNVSAFALSLDGDVAAADMGPKRVRIWWWRRDCWKDIDIPEMDEFTPITAMAWSPDGQKLIIGDGDGCIRLMTFPGGACAGAATIGAYSVKSCATLGNFIVAADDGGAVTLIAIQDAGLKIISSLLIPDVEEVMFGRTVNEILARTFGGAIICLTPCTPDCHPTAK